MKVVQFLVVPWLSVLADLYLIANAALASTFQYFNAFHSLEL
uniref:Uncharacterized protein n=1 Tax=Rhizophora mucronata TaxID=61149 RepID=A0A2P2NMA1_RHIMU